MICDALGELHQGKQVDIVVRVSIRRNQRCLVDSKKLQLMKVLGVASFKEVGNMVNDIVRFVLLDRDSYP